MSDRVYHQAGPVIIQAPRLAFFILFMLLSRFFHITFVLAGTCAALQAQTATITTLGHFGGVTPANTTGNGPRGGLVYGADGQLYGTTERGGDGSGAGNGVAYKVNSASGAYTLLAAFGGSTTGSTPTGKLLLANDGNFYGTTTGGGTDGRGTIFQMQPDGTLTTVYTFTQLNAQNTGSVPTDGLVAAANGYLYGTTSAGGASGYGTVFKILPGASSTPVRIVDFTGSGGSVRGTNASALVRASDGNFYGVTEGGGLYSNGTIFRLTPAGVFTTLTDFGKLTGTYQGPVSPRAALIQASNGVLYGTSAAGGTAGNGTVFSVTTAGVVTVLVNFSGDGGSYPGDTPEASLYQATDGYLYGTTRLGGTTTSKRGTVFRLATSGTFKSLIQFTGGSPVYGAEPRSALVQDNEGHLFGTTSTGGTSNLGTIFSLNDALPIKASVATGGVADPFGGTRATLTGTVNPQGTTALYYFEYGLTTSYGSRIPATNASAGAGKTNVAVRSTATGLIPATTYHYRLRAANSGGTTWGPDQTFVTGPNPNIVSMPTDQLVGVGELSQFNVSAIGVALKYAWHKTGVSATLSGAASLKFAKTSLGNAGSYYVVVSDGADVVTTSSVSLGAISVANSSIIVNEGTETTLVLPNAGPGLSFQWKTDAGNVVNDGRITGAQSAALRITNANAGDTNTYFCTVTLGALTLNSGNFTVTTRLRPVMNAPSIQPWTTNGQAFGNVTALNSPTSYAATGLPPGVVINALTGVFSGRPLASGTYTVQFTGKNLAGTGPTLNYPITVLPALVGEAGSFAGLVSRDPSGNNNLGGGINFTLTSAGTGTGKLTHLGVVFSFNTILNNVPGTTRSIGFTPLAGQKNVPAVTATLTGTSGDIVGTVNGVAFTALRNPWTSLAAVPTAQSGRFNVALSPASALVGNLSYPQGAGYGSLIVTATGGATWAGKLSDGTVTTGSSHLSAAGTVVLHHALYAVATGSAQGTLTIAGDSSVTSTGFDWLKNNQTGATRSYKSGFSLHTLDVIGSKYAKTLPGTQVIGLPGSTSNAQITFDQAGLANAVSKSLTFPSTNAITVPLPNPNTVKITSLDLNTGLFIGTFTLPDAVAANVRTTTFNGILLQGTHEGLGYFNLAQLPAPTTSIQLSGQVFLSAPLQ